MSKQSTDNLRRLVTGFRRGILARRRSNGYCWAVSASLEGYLSFLGHDCELTEGRIGDYAHFWITLSDGRIVDPTADQFATPKGVKMPKVYIGAKPRWYRECANGKKRLTKVLNSLVSKPKP